MVGVGLWFWFVFFCVGFVVLRLVLVCLVADFSSRWVVFCGIDYVFRVWLVGCWWLVFLFFVVDVFVM